VATRSSFASFSQCVYVCLVVFLFGLMALADTASYTGTLTGPTDTFQLAFTLPMATMVSVQTYGFGGGTNAAGMAIAAGGFDPLIALFDGTGEIIDGTSDTLLNYYLDPSLQGCPPAGMVTIGTGAGSTICGDISISFSLAAGSYTLVLADANYQPKALVEIGPTNLSDGFDDFTGGAFQTCNVTSDGTTCISPTADWAVDITGLAAPVPEPATLSLLAAGMGVLWRRKRRVR